ncbi:MAG TPA: NADPH-dependent assimilatory sulfite reductase hemoprotein subunit [Candidatus Acidoferrum sp.]|nr:NADPH-dependent assimilatory sulfite reductase hemoprotein subunit [Candidatus Acidoferrum sp.]
MINQAPTADVPKLTHNEEIKAAIPTLAGSIAATCSDAAADQFTPDDQQFLKFHGVYQQDDRDQRKIQKKFIMMARGRIPGGVMTSKQWLVFDELASKYGNNTLRITTRQSIQFHGIVLQNLRALVKGIHDSLLSTLAACGDVNRNVMAPPTPAYTAARDQVFQQCHDVAMALAPQTKAYHSIWIDGVQLKLDDVENQNFVDPLYGKSYLPRKFKVGFAIPPVNDIDVFTNDIGMIAIVENEQVVGYNVIVGGGMGRSHGNEQTYPRLADLVGFITPDKLVDVAKAVLTIHRDFGDRTDRKHARLKYVVQERGVEFMQREIEQRANVKLDSPRPFKFTTTGDLYGWRKQFDGKWFLGLFVEMGRVKDTEKIHLKTALRQVAHNFPDVEFRLSANQNVILANVSDTDKEGIDTLVNQHGVKTSEQASVLHAAAIACPALPTCGLSLSESERYLPGLIDRIERLCDEAGIGGEEIIIRMTGCPNGCARPYMAEIGFVGKAPGRYQLWLGGDTAGMRMNRLWKDVVKDAEMENELRPLLTRYAKERNPAERFGDWAARTVWNEISTASPKPTAVAAN